MAIQPKKKKKTMNQMAEAKLWSMIYEILSAESRICFP